MRITVSIAPTLIFIPAFTKIKVTTARQQDILNGARETNLAAVYDIYPEGQITA